MDLTNDKRANTARRRLKALDARTVQDMLDIVSIPAPPFGEAERGVFVAELLGTLGLDVVTDEVGNVIGSTTTGQGAPLILAAHLDTVFPAETAIAVRREGNRIFAPGIADNSRGLAGMIAIARVLHDQAIATRRPIKFIATVGEEGIGDLRGVKHLFRVGSPLRDALAFVSLDGTGRRRVVYRAIGSRRLRVIIEGPGGHSWADYGVANTVHAMGLAIGGIDQLDVPRNPRSSLTVGRIGGGTSVNAVPEQAWCEIDIRSEGAHALTDLEAAVRNVVQAAADHVNTRRKRGSAALTLDIRLIGDRPAGETSMNSAVVRAARTATRAFGDTPELVASSTDANIPIALGIPAIAIGAGGDSGGTHTIEEWYSNEGGADGLERAFLIVLELAGL